MKAKPIGVLISIICCTLLLLPALAQDSNSAQANNSCLTQAHRAFDFWVGDWQVNDAKGKPAGRNLVQSVQNGCALQENWTSASSGFSGTSLNYYNRQSQRWHQTWVDNQGGSLELTGNLVEGEMVLSSATANNPQGQTVKHVISWTPNPDGSVRQVWQTTTDGNSSVVFDGLYTKVAVSQ